MFIQILAIGRLREAFLQEGVQAYLERIRPYARVSMEEVDDQPLTGLRGARDEEAVKSREGKAVKSRIAQGSYVITLDSHGRLLTSAELAGTLEELSVYGRPKVSFLLGGTLGLPDDLIRQGDLSFSLGRITLPHQLARLVLVEQIYRAFKIIRGEPYHK